VLSHFNVHSCEPQHRTSASRRATCGHRLQVWSFGVSNKAHRVSRREFIRGYTHIIKSSVARQNLSRTLEDLLGGCWDEFDRAHSGTADGMMSREEFVDYQMCWNLSRAEAEKVFEEVAGRGAETITKKEYLLAAWDFYFSMQPGEGGGTNFYGNLKKRSSTHLTF
jgi:hypothetical protein